MLDCCLEKERAMVRAAPTSSPGTGARSTPSCALVHASVVRTCAQILSGLRKRKISQNQSKREARSGRCGNQHNLSSTAGRSAWDMIPSMPAWARALRRRSGFIMCEMHLCRQTQNNTRTAMPRQVACSWFCGFLSHMQWHTTVLASKCTAGLVCLRATGRDHSV